MLDLDSDDDNDPFLRVLKSLITTGDYSLRPGVTGPGYVRLEMTPAATVESFGPAEDQVRWAGIA